MCTARSSVKVRESVLELGTRRAGKLGERRGLSRGSVLAQRRSGAQRAVYSLLVHVPRCAAAPSRWPLQQGLGRVSCGAHLLQAQPHGEALREDSRALSAPRAVRRSRLT